MWEKNKAKLNAGLTHLKGSVHVLWVDDINTTGNLGDNWHESVLDVTTVPTFKNKNIELFH